MVELTDGSCFMLDVCTAPEVSVDDYPLYSLMPTDTLQMLMLRTRTEGDVSPYQLLMNNQSNGTLLFQDSIKGGFNTYKSPLLTLRPTPLSKVLLVLSDDFKTQVNLTFLMNEKDIATDEGSWFSKDNLLAAFPWSLEEMKSKGYAIFLMKGNGQGLRFYVAFEGNLKCQTVEGYIVVVEPDGSCSFERNGYHTSYEWVTTKNSKMTFKNAELSREFRLLGELRKTVRVYMRV